MVGAGEGEGKRKGANGLIAPRMEANGEGWTDPTMVSPLVDPRRPDTSPPRVERPPSMNS